MSGEINKEIKCPNCGADLLEVGIQEILIGCNVTADIKFNKKDKKILLGKTEIGDFAERSFTCLACNGTISEFSAIEMMDTLNEEGFE